MGDRDALERSRGALSKQEQDGTVEVRLVTRGGAEKRLATPNPPSVVDRKSVLFRDDTP